MEQDELSSDQIEQLLYKAEQRLKEAASNGHGVDHATKSSTLSIKESPTLRPETITKPYVSFESGVAVAQPSRLLSSQDKRLAEQPKSVENPMKKKALKGEKVDAGSNWFHLPRTNLTPELKRDLQILKMRSVLDPKRHYKKDSSKALTTEFSEVGTIVQGPTDFYSSRLLNRDRKRTLAEEVMASEDANGRFRNKYNQLQSVKTNGRRAFYNDLKSKRSRKYRR